MKISDYFSISINNIKGNKKNFKRNTILLALSLAVLIISSIAINSINNVFDKNIKYNISYRSIYVRNTNQSNTDDFIKKIENINHIEKAVEQKSYYVCLDVATIGDTQINGELSFLGANNDICPEIIVGRGFEPNEKDVCIIPKKFYPYYYDDSVDESKIINGESLLNKNITVHYFQYDYSIEPPQKVAELTKTFKIIGIYDNDINMGEYNECYINFDDVLYVYNQILENSNYNNEYDPILAIVDNSENVNSVLTELRDLGYYAYLRSTTNDELVSIIKNISITLSTCMLIIVISSIIINSIRTNSEKAEDIGLLKSFGYSNRNIWKITISESIISSIFSFIIAIVLVIIILILLKIAINFSIYELKRLSFVITYHPFLYSFLIALIIPLIGNFMANLKVIHTASIIKSIKK